MVAEGILRLNFEKGYDIMISEISKKADEYMDSAVKLLSGLISYKSVMGEPAEGMPYGKDCADCLKFAEDTLKADGFTVRNFDNHAITADFGEGEPELGILCHLDVVPTDGQEWHSDPFKAEIRDNKIYGRGSIDDKGPAAAVITAMRIIRDSGVKLRKNVRLILGSNEENGSKDMEYYTSKEKFPPMLFTPDGSFPVINIEKGMIRFEIGGSYGECGGRRILSLKGGSVVNAVPERAEAVVEGFAADEIQAYADKISLEGIILNIENISDNTVSIKVKGKGAHASTPEQGVNAITALLTLLSDIPLDDELHNTIKSVSEIFPFGEWDGSSAGVKCSEEKSGPLTIVLSLAECGGGRYSFKADSRFPVGRTSADIVGGLCGVCGRYGLTGKADMTSEPHYADENSPMIKTLLGVYEDFTGEKGKCIAIGGGTYVHDTENGVAFGAEWSDENNMHGADEFIGMDEFKKDIMIYTEAILRLCM